jgi:2-polyprenyl-3-methyl-5-hydroxy-6-metoxy-1,4-benzoquinol methylase
MSDKFEVEQLEKIARDSWYAKGANVNTVEYSFQIFNRFLKGPNVLELGPAEGLMTNHLARLDVALTAVDGSTSFCEQLKARLPKVEVVNSLFETFQPTKSFNTIILGHVLEHVESATDILKLVRSWLVSGGRVLASVPNSRSLHRQAAVIMGLLPFEESLNAADIHHGHRRVFNPETFRHSFSEAGFCIEIFGGYWLKPVSNRQIEESWSKEMLSAFMTLGERYPDIAGEIYVIATTA